MEENNHIFICILLCVIFIFSTIDSVKYYKTGRLCSQLTERIIESEDTNRRLTETVGECQSICRGLEQSVERNIETAKDAIEIIEELRTQVQNLETVIGNWDSSIYYRHSDSMFNCY